MFTLKMDDLSPTKNQAHTTSGTTYSWQSIPSPDVEKKHGFRNEEDLQLPGGS